MSQFYSDKSRETVVTALPDAEVFYMGREDFHDSDRDTWQYAMYRDAEYNSTGLEGWYYWFCFPGCLPDSDPIGPFSTEQEAIDACREDSDPGTL